MDELKQLIEENSANLPEDLENLVKDDSLPAKIHSIAVENNLNETQEEVLRNETYFVLLGMERIGSFQKNLEEQMMAGTEKPRKIVGEIHSKIFKPVEITLVAIEELDDRAAREEKIQRGREAFEETLRASGEVSTEQTQTLEKKDTYQNVSETEKGEIQSDIKPKDDYDISVFENMAQKTRKALEGENSEKPQTPEPEIQEVKKENEFNRYGIEPAKDLGAEDFHWQGNVSGVEIEDYHKNNQPSVNESERDEGEGLDKGKILNEIEYPPVYTPSSFSDKINKTVIQETEREELNPENLERVRKETYRNQDPYREPTD